MLVNCLTQVNDEIFLKSEANFSKNTQQILALKPTLTIEKMTHF